MIPIAARVGAPAGGTEGLGPGDSGEEASRGKIETVSKRYK